MEIAVWKANWIGNALEIVFSQIQYVQMSSQNLESCLQNRKGWENCGWFLVIVCCSGVKKNITILMNSYLFLISGSRKNGQSHARKEGNKN
jgi:hypothetical protein